MRYCLARLLCLLHGLRPGRHFPVRLCYNMEPDREYLFCGCGRLFWPLDPRAVERQVIDRLNATPSEP